MEKNLSARDLRAFLAVANTLSFSQAARELQISQSALSTLISRLESAMGSRLFDRTTRAVALSAAGKVLAAEGVQLLADLDRTLSSIQDITTMRRGRVTVATLPSLAASVIPSLFRSFADQHAGIQLSVIEALGEDAIDLLRGRRVDFALIGSTPSHIDLDYSTLMKDKYVLLASHSHKLTNKQGNVRFLDTFSAKHISLSRDTDIHQHVRAAALHIGINFQPAYEVNHLTTIGAMVAEGLGVAVLPRMAARAIRSKGIACMPLTNPVIRWSFGIAKLKEKPLTAPAEALLDLLKCQISKLKRY